MKIERIDIKGFGTLKPTGPISLARRINLFLGQNEAGKTTFQHAVLALLYGFYQGSRITPSERAWHERFRPWTNGAYGSSLDYVLDTGQRFRIERAFESDDIPTSVLDLTTGRDVTRDLGQGRHGNVPAAFTHLGMRRDVFVNTCFVGQAAVLVIDAPEAVAEAVVGIADTASVDASAAQALQRLDEAHTTQVGGPRARVTPLPLARGRLERTKEELRNLEEDQRAMEDDAARKDEAEATCGETEAKLRRVSYLKILSALLELEGTLDALRDIGRERIELRVEADWLKDYASFPIEVRDTLLADKARVDALAQQRDQLQRSWSTESPQLDTVQEEIRQCRNDVADLEGIRDFPLQNEETFNRLRFSLDDSSRKLTILRQQIRELRDKLDNAGETRYMPKSVLAVAFALALVLGISSIVTGFGLFGVPVAVVIAVGAAACYVLLKRPTAGKERVDELERTEHGEEARIAGLEHDLMILLQQVGIRADTVSSGVEMFQSRAASRRRLDQVEDDVRVLEERRKSLASAKQQFEDSENRFREAKTTLLQTLRRANVETLEVDEGIALFQEHYSKRLRVDAVQQGIRSLEDKRRILLGDRTEALLIERLEYLKAQKAALLSAAPELSGVTTESSSQELEGQEGLLRQQLAQLKQDITRLDTTVKTRLDKHRARCEIEEDLARYENEVEKLERFASALTLAKAVLREAADEVHRDFAPRLAQSLGQTLSLITHGRYSSVYVDPRDFAIRLQTPDSGAVVDSNQLSTGTQEQAYLLLRMELARMLSASRETLPLILDDPFVNFDENRLQRALELLVEVSRENQVFLFTKDSFIERWFRASCHEGTVFEIHELPAPWIGQNALRTDAARAI